MKVKLSVARKFLDEVGYRGTETFDSDKAVERLKRAKDLSKEEREDVLKSDEAKELLAEMKKAWKKDAEVTVVDDTEAEDDEDEKPAKSKKADKAKKPAKAAAEEEDEDDEDDDSDDEEEEASDDDEEEDEEEEEEEEEEAPAKAKKSKKAAKAESNGDDEEEPEEASDDDDEEEPDSKSKKAAKAKKGVAKKGEGIKKVGIIATIEKMLLAASKKEPITIKAIHKELVKKFGPGTEADRNADSMLTTVKVQVPGRMRFSKGYNVKKTDDGGFYISKKEAVKAAADEEE